MVLKQVFLEGFLFVKFHVSLKRKNKIKNSQQCCKNVELIIILFEATFYSTKTGG